MAVLTTETVIVAHPDTIFDTRPDIRRPAPQGQ
jgi:hypothetical protein